MDAGESTAFKTLKRVFTFRYRLVLEGIIVGCLAGLVTVLFRLILEKVDWLLHIVIDYFHTYTWLIPVWFGILIFISSLVWLLLKWEPNIGGSGIPQIKGEMQGQIYQSWWRVLLGKFAGGVLCIGSGLSLGREGPSIQLGAMVGKGFAKVTKRVRTEEKLLMSCGASAGLSAAFNAPFAGVLFSLEELHKNFSVDVLLSTMTASITADFISRYIFGLKPVFAFDIKNMMPLQHYWLVVILGIILGAFGVVYNKCIKKGQKIFDKIKNQYVKTVLPFLLAGILAVIFPAVLGGGHHLVLEISTGEIFISALGILLLVKFLFSLFSFSSGVPGGIFLPLLVLGAVTGGIFGKGCITVLGIHPDLLQNFIILGMAGYFAAIVRAPITGIILISEMTGGFSHLLTLSIVSLIAYITADLLKAKPIYDQLLERILSKRKIKQVPNGGEKILVESPVYHGALATGKQVKDISWPSHSLIVSIIRGEHEILPNGETVIQAGDRITLLCDEAAAQNVYELLEGQCQKIVMQK